MQCSCRAPSSPSRLATSEFLEGSQSGGSCFSLQTAPKSGSGRQCWRPGRPSKTGHDHAGVHTLTSSGRALCCHPCLSIGASDSVNHSEVQGLSLSIEQKGWSIFLLLFHISLSSLSLKRKVGPLGARDIPVQLQSEDTKWEKAATAGSWCPLGIFCHRQLLGVFLAGYETEHSWACLNICY